MQGHMYARHVPTTASSLPPLSWFVTTSVSVPVCADAYGVTRVHMCVEATGQPVFRCFLPSFLSVVTVTRRSPIRQNLLASDWGSSCSSRLRSRTLSVHIIPNFIGGYWGQTEVILLRCLPQSLGVSCQAWSYQAFEFYLGKVHSLNFYQI